ncbi:hypothetical protein BDZ89DRAFT_678919 [Hymenopellis radicata]|nr:hypothetical protein BDZ89DRAFT_678919 [Hymenopellis radicata]
MASRHPPHSSQPHAQYYYSDADAPHYSPHPNVQQYPAHLNVQHHDPSSESYPGAQPSPAVHVPPPYVAKITRPDAAVPPKYTHTWDEVQSDAEFFPAIFTENKGAFIRYLEASLVWKPRWFQDLELKPSGARKVLWPNVKYVSCHHISDDMHWSLRLLRYQLHVGQNTFKASAFAIMIVFEIIFVVLTPRPERWPNGLRTIESFTGLQATLRTGLPTEERLMRQTDLSWTRRPDV